MHLRTFLTPAFFQLNLFSYLALKVRCLLEFKFILEFYNVKFFKKKYWKSDGLILIKCQRAYEGHLNISSCKTKRLIWVFALYCLHSKPKVSMTSSCLAAAPDCRTGQSKGKYPKQECSILLLLVAVKQGSWCGPVCATTDNHF